MAEFIHHVEIFIMKPYLHREEVIVTFDEWDKGQPKASFKIKFRGNKKVLFDLIRSEILEVMPMAIFEIQRPNMYKVLRPGKYFLEIEQCREIWERIEECEERIRKSPCK